MEIILIGEEFISLLVLERDSVKPSTFRKKTVESSPFSSLESAIIDILTTYIL